MAETNPHGIYYPTPNDFVKDPSSPAKLADDIRLTATTTAAAIEAVEARLSPRKLSLGDDLDDYRDEQHEGTWWIYNTSEAVTIENRPPFTGGFNLEVRRIFAVVWQIAHPAGEAPQRTIMARKYTLLGGAQWSDWFPYAGEGASGGGSTDSYMVPHRHDMLKNRNRLGHGGTIGVGGKVAVGLSFDHGFAKYRDILLPHLIRLGLPHAVAVNTSILGSGESEGVTYSHLQDWAINHGVVLANHGRSHADATTEEGIHDMLIGSLDLLHEHCPKTIVDTMIAPGTSGTGFNGFNNGMDDYTKWWTHPAGRIMIDYHASVTAGLHGMALPLDGDPVQSMDRVGFDYGSHASVIQNRVTALQGTGMGIQIFNHPSLIDKTGYTTSTRVVQFLEWLAAERDAGRVEVLSSSAFAWAVSGTEKRHDLIAGMTWSGEAVTVPLTPLWDWARGYQRQLSVTCSTAADVTLTVSDDTGLLDTSVTQSVTSGGVARLNFGIPTDSDELTLTATTTSGTLSDHHVCAV